MHTYRHAFIHADTYVHTSKHANTHTHTTRGINIYTHADRQAESARHQGYKHILRVIHIISLDMIPGSETHTHTSMITHVWILARTGIHSHTHAYIHTYNDIHTYRTWGIKPYIHTLTHDAIQLYTRTGMQNSHTGIITDTNTGRHTYNNRATLM